MLKNADTQYGSVAKIFHWVIALLVFGMLIAGYFMGGISDKPLRGEVVNIHKLIGLTILGLVLLRAVWALSNPKPTLPLGTPVWMIHLAHSVHYLLYAVLIIMPLSGWVMAVASGHTPHLGNVFFNLPINQSKPLAQAAFNVHWWIAIAIITLVTTHVFAALYHHYIKRDDVLKRMWF